MDEQVQNRTRKDTDRQQNDTDTRNGAPPARKSRFRRLLAFTAGGIVLVAVAVAGTIYWLHARHFVSTDDAFVDAYTTQVSPQVAGRVTRLLFTDNQHVTAGQTLLLLDPRDYQVKLDQAKAQAANARASQQQAQAQITLQEANLDEAEANVRVAEADLTQARQDYDRYRAIDPKAVTRQQIDNATAAFRSAEAKRDASRQAVGAAQAQVQAARSQQNAAAASVQQADANVAAATLQLSYCTLTAPVAGIVAHRSVAVGNYVTPGQPLFAIVQDERWVTANFKETQLAAIRPGQKVDIEIDAIPGVTFHGRVDSFQPGTGSAFSVLPAENATGNYVKIVQRVPVRIVFDDDRLKHDQLSPGMSVVPSVRVR
ncbi:MAG TPA: HlyD family secretion protein [Acetobacteraceae bacterium]|nr:HlyD family secretion protein [Acetobacteraceae bacterium]